MEGDGGNGRNRWRWTFYGLLHRDGPGLRNADGACLGVADDVAGGLAGSGFETAFENGRLPSQGVIWMYNPHNLWIFYRYRGFI